MVSVIVIFVPLARTLLKSLVVFDKFTFPVAIKQAVPLTVIFVPAYWPIIPPVEFTVRLQALI